ncbi:Hint domain-containing protein [Rhodovulum strictum]|nr:Hint domain-containing protein [Rhodovulum strictum]
MPMIQIYDWSQVAVPASLSGQHLLYATHANVPGTPHYNPFAPGWTGKTYSYTGGSPTKVFIDDDDAYFEDGYVETGAPATLRHDVTLNGKTFAAGSIIENEFALTDAGGVRVWVVRINGENVGFAPQAAYPVIPAGSTFTPTKGSDGLAADSSDGQASAVLYSGVVCFDEAVQIATPGGPRLAGALRPGDMVLTADHGARPVLWAGRTDRVLSGPDDPARPIRIAAGALGGGLPARNLVLSPQHRVLLAGPEVARRCGMPEILVPARALLALEGVRVMRGKRAIGYVHLLLARHEILTAEGLAVESFYPGRMALRLLPPAQRAALARHLPADGYGPFARPVLTCRRGQALARSLWPRSGAKAPVDMPLDKAQATRHPASHDGSDRATPQPA